MKQKLLTQQQREQLPPLRAQEHEKDPMVYVKLFTPMSDYTFFITEFDGQDTLFGSTFVGEEGELGYISLSELESTTLALRVKVSKKITRVEHVQAVERDTSFQPQRLSEAKATYKKEHGFS